MTNKNPFVFGTVELKQSKRFTGEKHKSQGIRMKLHEGLETFNSITRLDVLLFSKKEKIEVKVLYASRDRKTGARKKSHEIIFNFKKTNYYCMNCGKKSLWMQDDGGDYYEGEAYYCTSCDHRLNTNGVFKTDKHYLECDRQKLQGIKRELKKRQWKTYVKSK